ncbi:MAG: ABC transporter ATP-binding protein [Magnetospirillum sp.]|jgi:NitT/TauT family transport system ATP-binding protein|nr:ABC transporter ATP-binding protein [Magnetospirillum sp.]
MSDPRFIRVRDVAKTYVAGATEVEAVARVAFDVAEGQFVSILGPSGCGKSTLLMMCAGLEAASDGTIEIAGRPVVGPRREFGLIFQDATLLPWKTSLENVLFPIRMMKRDPAQYRDRAEALLRQVGLGDFLHKRPSELSGGMRQRVAICRALIHDPELLMMDEPFSALDAITRDEMNEALARIWETQRKTGLFVTHSIREAVFLADRVLVMSGRPSTIALDFQVPFARPRDPALVETPEFAKICAMLKRTIEAGYARSGRSAA